ncbi:MAG TPA: ribonuclease III [Xanthomonadales bacterium]|nr:ribonuclease III [Xanthomonadales bacterium]
MPGVIDTLPGVCYRFKNPRLLQQALTHKSGGPVNFERLEFLGDSILNLVVSIRLFEHYPEAAEGDLSRMRARIVRGRTLTEIATSISLGKYLILGEGEMKSGGFRRASILADAFEALLGAIYLDGGYAASHAVIVALCDPLITSLPSAESLKDAKTRLQEWLQAHGRPLPLYHLDREEGADHAKCFYVRCSLVTGGLEILASGKSRRQAEQAAAAEVLARLPADGTPTGE